MLRLSVAFKNIFFRSHDEPIGPGTETGECSDQKDPSFVFESLSNSHHWSMGGDYADAFGGAHVQACPGLTDSWGSIWWY